MRLPPPNTPIQNMYSRKCGSLRRISNNMPRLNGSLRPTAAFSSASSANSRRTRAARYSHAASRPAAAPPPNSQRESMYSVSSVQAASAAAAETASELTMTMRPV